MADQPINTPPNFSQTGAGVPPANFQAQQTAQKAVNDLLGDQVKLTNTVADIWKELPDSIKATVNVTQDWQTKLKGIVKYTEDYEDAFKRMLQLSKQYGETGIFRAKNYGDLLKNLQDLKEAQNKLMKDGFFDKTQQRELKRQTDFLSMAIEKVGKNMEKAGKRAKDAIDPELLAEVGENARKASADIEKMGRAWNNVHLRPLTSNLARMNDALGGSSQFLSRVTERATKFAGIATKLEKVKSEAAHTAKLSMKETFGKLTPREQLTARAAGLTGKPSDKRLSKQTREQIRKDLARNVTEQAGGGGFIDRFLTQRAMKQVADAAQRTSEGGQSQTGFLGRAYQAGGGSVMRGASNMAQGAGAGFLAHQAEAAANLSPYLMVAELIAKFIDANAKANSEIATSLGEAGIFGGGASGVKDLMNVRKALRSENMGFNFTGESYQKNLKIAQAIKEGGVNLPELAGGVRPEETGGVGMVKNIAYHGAKLAGYLDEGAAAKEIMKVLQEYHTSFTGVQDFFEHINRDTARAGITTTKYIGIIDEVNKQFDRFGMSLEQTVTTMRMLGRTGTQSAEDVRDAMGAITNAGQKRTFEMQAFLGMQTARTPGAPEEQVRYQESNVAVAKKRAQEALGIPSIGLDATQVKSRDDVREMKAHLARSGGGTPAERQTAMDALNQLDMEMQRLEGSKKVRDLAHAGRFGEAGLAQASQNSMLGYNLTGSTMEQFRAIQVALQHANKGKGYTLQQVMGGAGATDPTLVKLMEALQTDPSILQKMLRVFDAQGHATMQGARQGILGEETYKQLVGIADQHGLKMKGSTPQGKIQSLSGTDQDKLAIYLADNENILKEIMKTEAGANALAQDKIDQDEKDRQREKAEEVATASRPLADVFADAFENLFVTISAPVEDIYELLSRSPLGSKLHKEETARLREMYGGADPTTGVSGPQAEYFEKVIAHLEDMKVQSKADLARVNQELETQTDPKKIIGLQAQKNQLEGTQKRVIGLEESLKHTALSATGPRGIVDREAGTNAYGLMKAADDMMPLMEKGLKKIDESVSSQQEGALKYLDPKWLGSLVPVLPTSALKTSTPTTNVTIQNNGSYLYPNLGGKTPSINQTEGHSAIQQVGDQPPPSTRHQVAGVTGTGQ
jgi:hypothetical protein